MNNLALLCQKTGRPEEAISWLERALPIWEKALGPGHPNIARALTNLAGIYGLSGRLAEAAPLFRRALSVAENALGPESPLAGTVLSEYAVLLRKLGRKDQARTFDERARAIRRRSADHDLGRHTIDVIDLRPQNATYPN